MKILYVPWLPFKADGMALKHIILIRNNHRNNAALLKHEEKHIEQQKDSSLIIWIYKYLTDLKFRQEMEIEAYKVSLAYGISLQYCVKELYYKHDLNMSFNEIKKLLRG